MVGDTVFESNTTENGYGLQAYAGENNEQSFTPQTSHTIYRIRLKLTKTGSPVGDMTISILDASSNVLCISSPTAMASITDSTYTFNFTTNPVLLAGVVYRMSLVCTGGDVTTNWIGIRIYDSAATDIYPRGAAVGQPTYCDWYFVECGDVYVPVISHMFVAVANNSKVSSASTLDGITWTARTLLSYEYWYSVAYGNNTFVAVGYSGAVATSLDGINWTMGTMPSNANWYSVAYGNGVFVAIAADPSTAAVSSPDGITWTARTLPSSGYWYSVAYGNGMFVALSAYTAVAATSPDGITWTARTLPSSSYWQSVAYGNGMFVAVATAGTVAASSPDGITWTARTLPSLADWYSVAYGKGMFVAVGYGGVAASSPDGITWTARTMPASSPIANWSSVAYGNGMFIAVSVYGITTMAAYSLDGITWAAATMPASASWISITYGDANPSPLSVCIVHSFPWVGRFQMCKVKEGG